MLEEERSVVILLATYNGEKYIRDQLDSILNNTYKNFKIIISDDCSSDNTLSIIKTYQSQNDNIIIIEKKNLPHGAFFNFLNLVRYVKTENIQADYYMFSDQDDFWKSGKIKVSVEEMLRHDDNIPLLVYTSKEYVDEELNTISFNLPKEDIFDINILHQNKTFGCTYIFNRPLLKILQLEPSELFINYDHYVAFQAFIFGKVYYLPQKTILYRQHGNNVSGVVNKSFQEKLNFKNKYKKNIHLYKNLIDYMFENRFYLNSKDRICVEHLYKAKKKRLLLFFVSLLWNIKKNTILGSIQFYLTFFEYDC